MNKKLITVQDQIFCLVLTAMVAGLMACTKIPVKHPSDTPPVMEEKVTEQEKPVKQIPLTRVLMEEAGKLSDQDNNQDALFVYNQALSLADPQDGDGERKIILSGIEKVLAKTRPSVIEGFIQVKNLAIPRALLLYWLGLNQATQNNYIEAKKALLLFINTYPDHAYAEDARELLNSIKSATFKKDTIGCLLPLSGKYQMFGQRALKGIQLAIQELSKRENKNIHVLIKDTQSNPERAVLCVDELNQEKVMGIIGPMLTVKAAGIRAQELGIPLIALTQKSEFSLQGDYLFSNFITPEMQVQALASYIFMELGIKKVAILYPDERYGKRYMDLFWDAVDEFNGEVVGVEPYDGNKTDFTTPIKKLTGEHYPIPEFLMAEISRDKAETENFGDPGVENPDVLEENQLMQEEEPRESSSLLKDKKGKKDKIEIDFQALFIPDSVSRINLILPQLAFNDARGMVLLGTNLWHQPALLTGAKGYNKNCVITDGYFGDSSNRVTAEFEKSFTDLYETSPGYLEAIAYDTVLILFTAASGVDSRENLKNALQGTMEFEGVTGNTVFDKTGKAHKELFLITVKRGKFMEIDH